MRGINVIQGISQYNSFQSSYKIASIPRLSEVTLENEELKNVNLEDSKNGSESLMEVIPEPFLDLRPRFSDLNNVSINFNKGDDYGYLGADSSIDNLDVKKAIADMKKDSIFRDYQYFVGSSKNINFESEDGKVVIK